ARAAQLVHERLDLILPDAEGDVGHELPRMGDRRVGKGLANDADAHAADLAQRVGPEEAIAPARLGHVLGDEVTGEAPPPLAIAEQLAHALEAVGELPVRG